MTAAIEAWDRARLGDLVALCETALPDERLTGDELEACCFDDDGVVLGERGGHGAIAACTRSYGEVCAGFVKLLAVEPSHQGEGLGRALLAASIDWARSCGASMLSLGGSAPFYLWPGVDVRMTRMLALAESARFRVTGAELDMGAATTFRTAIPDGFEVRRVLDEPDERAVVGCVERHWPLWVPELRRAIEHGSCIGAWDVASGAAVAFACHSVNRAAWVGPIGTDPAWQHRRLAAALMSEVCRDLAAAGHQVCEIAWVGPVGFYAKTMGAVVTRVYRTYVLDL